MKNNGYFIISLDFELYWGIFDKVKIKNKTMYFERTLNVIPQILDLFKDNNIKASWASVGFLFFNDIKDLKNNLPENIPQYENKKLSAYQYIQNSYDNTYKTYHFAPDLIKTIAQTPGQEVASHTLSHYYCLEPGQNSKDFDEDIKTHNYIAKRFGINLNSLIFPRNQYNKAYESILLKNGIKSIRTNPKVWFWDTTKPETIWHKIFRTADAYIPISNMLFYFPSHQNGIIKIPASRFFRPPSRYKILNKLRLKRIKNEMTKAAKENKVYHLWWHPHNFGINPKMSLTELKEIIDHYNQLEKNFKFTSVNMNTFSKLFQ